MWNKVVRNLITGKFHVQNAHKEEWKNLKDSYESIFVKDEGVKPEN